MKTFIVLGIAVLVVTSLFSASAEGVLGDRRSMRVAIVEDYSNKLELITLYRAGNKLPFSLGTELIAGDKFEVTGDGYIVLRFSSSSERVISKNSPFHVTDRSGPLQNLSANFDRVLSVVAWWDGSIYDEPMRSRDGVPPVLPALERVTAPLVLAGARALQINWIDGKGPFKIQLVRDDAIVAAASTEAGERSAEMEVTLESGATYILLLIDQGRPGTAPSTYEINAVDTLPSVSVTVAEDDTWHSLLELAELASTERGRWAFEALQQLHILPDQSRFRSALIEAVAHGDRP